MHKIFKIGVAALLAALLGFLAGTIVAAAPYRDIAKSNHIQGNAAPTTALSPTPH